jgi:acyl-CoA dehydrogenase
LTSPIVDVESTRAATRDFIREVVIPAEETERSSGLTDDLRQSLQAAARTAGLFAPHMPAAYGGLGLSLLQQSLIFEEAGTSLLGPLALNCAAPDEGNMGLLLKIATPEQKQRYLMPLAKGEIRSCFAMTEPAPGAGSDPAMLRTEARKVADGWQVDGQKWLISGARGAAFCICVAQTAPRGTDHQGRATMFLIDSDNPGFGLGRSIPTMSNAFVGGHSEVFLTRCFVPDDAVLGEPNQGLSYLQVRLAPARLTHCMRWLGIARRSLDIAMDRIAQREAFGTRLENLGLAQALVADSIIDLESSRQLIRHACATIDSGERGSLETSIAKVHVAEAVNRVVDRAVQLCGGLGVTYDRPLARFLNEVRAFRIYDGSSEVHRWSIARRASAKRARERHGS